MSNLFTQGRLKDIAGLGVVVLLVQVVLSKWIYPLFGKTTQNLFSITPATAVQSTTVGDKVLGILSGVIPFDLGSFSVWISIFIGAFILLIAGYWVYEQKWAWKGKNIYQRLWAILLYGSLVLYVFLLITKMSVVSTIALPLLIGLGVNYIILAFVVGQLARRLKFLRI